jgi:hypothetical protein
MTRMSEVVKGITEGMSNPSTLSTTLKTGLLRTSSEL